MLATTLAAIPSDTSAHSGHPWKRLFPDRWYQDRVLDFGGDYFAWMTLTGHRHYESGTRDSWKGPTGKALADWNDPVIAPNTVYITDYATQDPNHDVHTAVRNNCSRHFGRQFCTDGALGVIFLLDEMLHECDLNAPNSYGDCHSSHSRPNTWWYAIVVLDNDAHSGAYGSSWFRRATTTHELGHAIVLKHDNSPADAEDRDFVCGDPRTTIMDYDCILLQVLKRPQPWDSCGINHRYYDPGVGYAGC